MYDIDLATGLPSLLDFPEGSAWRVHRDGHWDTTWLSLYTPVVWYMRRNLFRRREALYSRQIGGTVTPEKILALANNIMHTHAEHIRKWAAEDAAEKYHGYYPPKSL